MTNCCPFLSSGVLKVQTAQGQSAWFNSFLRLSLHQKITRQGTENPRVGPLKFFFHLILVFVLDDQAGVIHGFRTSEQNVWG